MWEPTETTPDVARSGFSLVCTIKLKSRFVSARDFPTILCGFTFTEPSQFIV